MEKITAKTKNELAQQVHENAVQHGFWAEYTSPQHFLCLVICELAEAVEAMRKGFGLRANVAGYKKLLEVHPDWQDRLFREYVKDSVEDEIADAYIRLLDLAGGTGITFNERVQHNILVSTDKTFTENIYLIMSCVGETTEELVWVLSFTTQQLEALAEQMGFDLLEHVQLKMEYNQKRSYRHGKAF